MITQLWLADTRKWPDECPQNWVQQLSRGEKHRLERISSRSPVGREYLFGRTVLRYALSQNFPEIASWELAAEGPTRVQNPTSNQLGTEIHVNLSHSRGWVMCAFSSAGACGCDIEAFPRRGNTQRIASRYFTAKEVDALKHMQQDVRNDAFLTMWTLKEAYLKARKTGISGGLGSLEVVPAAEGWQARSALAGLDSDLSPALYRYAGAETRAAAVFFRTEALTTRPEAFEVICKNGKLQPRVMHEPELIKHQLLQEK